MAADLIKLTASRSYGEKEMNLENIERQAALIKLFKEDYASCVLWGRAPDGDVKPMDLINWIVANRHLVNVCDEIEKLNG